jgi:hypothetical protein
MSLQCNREERDVVGRILRGINKYKIAILESNSIL